MSSFVRSIPEGDDKERLVCADCGHVAYENPKVVVGSVVEHNGQVLLCRRAIEPRRGFWTLPAGYMELDETVEEAAGREALEEAGARITINGLLAVYSLSHISQVQLIFRATLADPEAYPLVMAGPESMEVGFFEWSEIPWSDLAFASVAWALNAWRRAGPGVLGPPEGNPPEYRRGPAIPAGQDVVG
ncbi:MAG TPA: NUDIX hydrolase [Acetobacteraceae bacterium]|nr:NUDIX hydrolase [Acetobacteraceae bacterium]